VTIPNKHRRYIETALAVDRITCNDGCETKFQIALFKSDIYQITMLPVNVEKDSSNEATANGRH